MTFNPVVLAPTFNNAGTLPDVLGRLAGQRTPVIVVNDGSTDGTAAILTDWAAAATATPGDARHVTTHPKNRGKAAALMTGFSLAAELGYTHTLTIDTDGQLSPEQVPEVLAVAREHPDALVLGTRDDTAADYPARSRLGRRVANLLVWMESGLRVSDSQCGLRVYPMSLGDALRCRAGRYGFETEVIVRVGWAGGSVVEVPATCRYFPRAERVSHFQPWRDSLRAAAMHARLVARALVPIGANGPKPAAVRGLDDGPAIPLWKRVLAWLSPRDAWRQVKADRPDGSRRTIMSMSLAVGAFIGCVPVYGLHAVIALYAARRLNLNPLGTVLGTQVAIPPLCIVTGVAAVAVGHLLRHGRIPPPSDFEPLLQGLGGVFQVGGWMLVDGLIGSVFVGVAAMVTVFFLADWLLRRVPSEATVVAPGTV